ncbi:TetR family transcriptional regulator [Mycolicibacterium goodii]|uniref:TetR/AcrR family transcriptional regulator n=1 Tax=Mycolicibacterium goodii TaxID=134601 RepID=UPI001BDD033F|nr:TetR/AcrR family transcriptional regulator [Mycolicibacterium goodii]MBU8820819.1 TetR family transcriptional regulator [Mycolicibacterium goodii]
MPDRAFEHAPDFDAIARSPSSLVGLELPPRMRNMLDSALRVVARDGVERLSLRALSREAGESTSLILYYFGSMETLEALLVDFLWHSIDVDYLATLETLPEETGARIDALIAFHSRIAEDPHVFALYADLIANVLRSSMTRAKIADIYRTYRDTINRPAFTFTPLDNHQIDAHAGLILAAGEGIPLHGLVEGGSTTAVGSRAAFTVLSHIMKRRLGCAVGPPESLDLPILEPVATNRPVREPLPGKRTAQHLVNSAQSLIYEAGVRSLSLDALSRRSGEARPSVGYHFTNKQNFIERVVVEIIHDWVQLFEDFIERGDDRDPCTLRRSFFDPGSPMYTMVLVLPLIGRSSTLEALAADSMQYVRNRLSGFFAGRYPGHSASYYTASAMVFTACLFGLGLQHLYDNEGFDISAATEAMCGLRIGS